MNKSLWEILVPTTIERNGKVKHCKIAHHRRWDKKVRELTGGLTVFQPAKGDWYSLENSFIVERMIPVRIYCTEEDMNKIADLTASHYNQKAVMFYKVTDEVQIKTYERSGNAE